MLDRARPRSRLPRAGALAIATLLAGTAHADVSPHLSEATLPASNGHGAIAYDRTQYKLVQFLEHAYQQGSSSGAASRNFMYDSYPGVRIGTTGTWLNTVAPIVTEYVPGTGIIHTRRMVSGVQLDEYDFSPMGVTDNTSVTLVEATQIGASGGPVDAYQLFNYHLGTGAPSPGTDSEFITYDGTRDTFYESGPANVTIAYFSIAPSTHHGCTPNNPFGLLNSGSNLKDDTGDGSPTTDAVPGFQSSFGSLAVNASAWAGWTTVLAADTNGGAAVDRMRTWVNGRSPATILADETAAWHAWTTAPPSGASALESALALQAQVMARMGQVTDAGSGNGQILASVAPGQWNIAWVRDMAYAVVGLVRSGHYAEAKAAIAFQLQATVGGYQSYVGAPYQISVVRYYGDGTEWSDSNSDGPNIEFDGFGLFLWELDEYVKASGDTASLTTWWPTVKSKIADTLVSLQESTGLIAADSSIWESHWDGQQRHFAYTTITAANGLCAASDLAQAAGDTADVATYLTAGQLSRDALLPNLRAADGSLVQSTEALASGSGWLDAAAIEAIDFGLVDPTRHTATQTLADIAQGLTPQSGRGFMRSDAGDAYSSNEWVFVDLRAARALELHADATASTNLFAWNVDQASDNFGELSELHDPVTADYAGQSPMVGFGAGAYLLALYDRGSAGAPACGAYAAEAPNPTGSDGGSPVGGDDAGTTTTPGKSGCGCAAGGDPLGAALIFFPVVVVVLFRRRRS